ncbi:MAG: hypothetical protein FVQ83_02580 [Chloroflexi bacterium]|nr:hypothetical protein [Chloroflexota bacterium]
MNRKSLNTISNKVYQRFPEVAGNKPRVKNVTRVTAKSVSGPETFELTFRGTAINASGKNMPRLVRVVANAKGKILRISTSR